MNNCFICMTEPGSVRIPEHKHLDTVCCPVDYICLECVSELKECPFCKDHFPSVFQKYQELDFKLKKIIYTEVYPIAEIVEELDEEGDEMNAFRSILDGEILCCTSTKNTPMNHRTHRVLDESLSVLNLYCELLPQVSSTEEDETCLITESYNEYCYNILEYIYSEERLVHGDDCEFDREDLKGLCIWKEQLNPELIVESFKYTQPTEDPKYYAKAMICELIRLGLWEKSITDYACPAAILPLLYDTEAYNKATLIFDHKNAELLETLNLEAI